MPATGSRPTVASSSPSRTDSQPFYNDFAPTEDATAMPKRKRANISGGPKAVTAQRAMVGVAMIMRIAEASPPIAEHITAAPIAMTERSEEHKADIQSTMRNS